MKSKQALTLEQRVIRFIQENCLISSQHTLLVAVSGGPDSVCLLHILNNLKGELGISLHIAHLNHQLRGAESDADAQYVSDLASHLNISATVEQRDVKGYKTRAHVSLEEAAREVRYAFLAQVARSIGANRAAIGHTIDDHIETILMHLIRGTGTRGLRGLQPHTEWKSKTDSLAIIRPMLQVSREETGSYCRRHKLRPRIDASNLSLSPLRNRIRHQLLPLLRGYNPRVDEALMRTARIASDDLAFLDEEIARIWDKVAQERESTIILDKEGFGQLPSALKRHLLRTSIEKLLGNIMDIETRHIEQIMAALTKPAGRRLSLPGGLTFSIDYDKYLLGQDLSTLSPFPTLSGEFPLKIPGETSLPGWHVQATIINREQMAEKGKFEGAKPLQNLHFPLSLEGEGDTGGEVGKEPYKVSLDLERTGNKLMVRSRQPGDRFQPLGMSQPKKLNEFMINVKIPQAWRQRVPIVCSPEHIVWVVGWRIDERVKVTDTTKQILCLTFERQ